MIATLHKYIGDETVIFNSLASSFHIPSLLQALQKISGISAELQQINATGFDN